MSVHVQDFALLDGTEREFRLDISCGEHGWHVLVWPEPPGTNPVCAGEGASLHLALHDVADALAGRLEDA